MTNTNADDNIPYASVSMFVVYKNGNCVFNSSSTLKFGRFLQTIDYTTDEYTILNVLTSTICMDEESLEHIAQVGKDLGT